VSAEPEEGALDELGTANGAGAVHIGGYVRERPEESGAFAGKGQRVRGKLDRRRQTHRPTAGRWRAHLHGFTCNDCGASTTTDRSEQGKHDRYHEDEDEFRAKLEADNQHMADALRELARRNLDLADTVEATSARIDALLIGLGLPDDEALENVVRRVISFVQEPEGGK
jgi:hypothetical protein